MPSSDSRKNQTFTFQRSKLVAKPEIFTKRVLLDKEMFPKDVPLSTVQSALTQSLVVSHSGRTLAEILSLSYPEELSKYTIESVEGIGRKGTVVTYPRPESGTEVCSFFTAPSFSQLIIV